MDKQKLKCHGRGDCLEQTDRVNVYDKSQEYECGYECKPEPCPCCKDLMPKYVFDYNKGRCMVCGTYHYSEGKECHHEWKTKPNCCTQCGLVLRPFKTTTDWSYRKMHKKCWLKQKREDEEYSDGD